ncbi:MAG: hypothetical protein HYU84_05035, partial [Chloroflexi bacterium]|nr:hypothetical protein [Chloroflexota bacterium]
MKRLVILTLIFLTACTSSATTPTPASFFDVPPVTPTQAFGTTPQPPVDATPATSQSVP